MYDIDDFGLWIINNPDEFENDFPEEAKGLKEAINSPGFTLKLVNLIQKLPEIFSNHFERIKKIEIESRQKTEIEQLLHTINSIISKELSNEYLESKRQQILPELKEIQNYINTKYYQPDTRLQKKTSYVWQNNPDEELPELYSLMMDKYKLIAPETTPVQFKAVFTGQPIDDTFEPIRWHQDNASELLYFIDRLEQSNNIVHNPKRADYQKLKACFVKPEGKPFTAAWKSLKSNITINLSPNKQKAIDELVNQF